MTESLHAASLHDAPITMLDGTATTFGAAANGNVALVVNVASRCGLSPQYEQLEALQRRYQDRGFVVIGFPSNQFLQELGTSEKCQAPGLVESSFSWFSMRQAPLVDAVRGPRSG